MKTGKNIVRLSLLYLLLSPFMISCNGKKHTFEVSEEKFEHNGQTREYIYYAPGNLTSNAPLVVVLHGYTESAEKIMVYSEMNRIAKENNFAVVYPQGTKDNNSRTFWNVGYAPHTDITTDDVGFIITLVKYLQHKHAHSVTNTFVTGMSNGGVMCYVLICKHPNVFKAAAPVAGVMLQSFTDECDSMAPIPLLAVFGTDDHVTKFDGDLNNNDGRGAYPSIPFTINYWAEKINYNSIFRDTLPDINFEDGSYIVRERYVNDQNENEVLFYKIIHGRHDWPGARGNMDVTMSNEIWQFFKEYLE